MSEFHVTVTEKLSGHGLAKVDNPGISPVSQSAGKAVTSTKNASGIITAVHGTVAGIVHDNPA